MVDAVDGEEGSKAKFFARSVGESDVRNSQSSSSAETFKVWLRTMFFLISGTRGAISVAVYRWTRGERAMLRRPTPDLTKVGIGYHLEDKKRTEVPGYVAL